MSGIRKEIYKGQEILVIDYNGCMTDKEMFDVLYKATEVIKKDNKPYLQLTILEDAYASYNYIKEVKRVAKEMPKTAIKRAVVGINSNARKVLLKGYNLVLGGKGLVPFDTLQEAKDWLVE